MLPKSAGSLASSQRGFRPSSSRTGVLRHSAAKLRRDVGDSIEEVSGFLDHSSLAVTSVYLRRLEGQEDRSWTKVAEAIGV